MPTKDPIQGSLELEDNEGPPSAVGDIVLDGTEFKAMDGLGVFNLRQSQGDAICFVVMTTEGGIVYGNAGEPLLKASA